MPDDHCCDDTHMCGGFICTNSGWFKFTEEQQFPEKWKKKREKIQSERKSWIWAHDIMLSEMPNKSCFLSAAVEWKPINGTQGHAAAWSNLSFHSVYLLSHYRKIFSYSGSIYFKISRGRLALNTRCTGNWKGQWHWMIITTTEIGIICHLPFLLSQFCLINWFVCS